MSKNLRLSFPAWQQLRLVKHRLKDASTYSDVLTKIFDEYKDHKSLSADVRIKEPIDDGDFLKKEDFARDDKTIVVSDAIHDKILYLKEEYAFEKGFSSRGPKAVSISEILLDLIRKFKEKHSIV